MVVGGLGREDGENEVDYCNCGCFRECNVRTCEKVGFELVWGTKERFERWDEINCIVEVGRLPVTVPVSITNLTTLLTMTFVVFMLSDPLLVNYERLNTIS